MSNFKTSKYRNIAASLGSRESNYEHLKVADHIIESNALTCNHNYVCYIDSAGNGSAIALLPLTNTGTTHKPSSINIHQPLIRGHTQPVQDIQFNPFKPTQLASCAMDGLIKLWDIPESEGITEDFTTPIQTLYDTDKGPVRELAHHIYSNNILLTRGSRNTSLFDLTTNKQISGTNKTTPSAPTGDIQSICWSYDGNTIALTGKDKKLKLIDIIRSNNTTISSIVNETAAHTGAKGSRVLWLGETPNLITCGHNSYQEREMFLWDSRQLTVPVKRERFDASSGLLMPIYDPDTNLLVVGGRGDSFVRLYEVSASGDDVALVLNHVPVGQCSLLLICVCSIL